LPLTNLPLDKLKVHTTGRAVGVVARTLEILEQVVGSDATENLVKNGHKVTQQGFWRDGKLTKMTETWDCDSQYNYVSLILVVFSTTRSIWLTPLKVSDSSPIRYRRGPGKRY
jgi:hypothetical protein